MQDQSAGNLTVDTAYTVPLGTELYYTSTCQFDSEATEISSESDYQKSLSKEIRVSESLSASGKSSYAGVTASFSTTTASTKSEKLASFSRESQKENVSVP